MNKSKSNFTNLSNTYLYGKDSWRNFTKKYFNNDQSIDDPVFTGFSMSIDDLTSPLFFTNGMDAEQTLRNNNGGNADLATSIEKHLEKVNNVYIKGNPDDYEINTKSVKDSIDYNENYRAGYGLQDRVYMDNVLYGAMEYIYMVDRVVDGNVKDSIGVSDLGNGTPNRSRYDVLSDALDNAVSNIDDSVPDLKDLGIAYKNGENVDKEAFDNIVNNQRDKFNNELQSEDVINERREKEDIYNASKDDYLSTIGKSDSDVVDLNYYDNELKKYEELCKREHISSGEKTFSQLKDKVYSKYNALMDAIGKRIGDSYETIKSELDRACDEFNDAFGKDDAWKSKKLWAGAEKTNIDFTKSKECKEREDLPKISELFSDVVKVCEKVYDIFEKQIKKITSDKSFDEYLESEKKRLNKLASELYGVDSMGNPYTKKQSEEKGTGTYGTYINAKKDLETDTQSQLENQIGLLDEAQANYDNIVEYKEYEAGKQQTTFSPPREVVVDNEGNVVLDEQGNPMITSNTRNRSVLEVPQTVYDIMGFIDGMKKLTTEYPYVMQTITGLDEAYKTYFYNKDDAYLGSGDNKITITCYESLDLRVSSMFNKYFNAVYDRQYKRERVPINLRRFNCSVFVHDIRNFRHSLSKMDKFYENSDGDNVLSKIVEVALNSMSVVEFKFFDCEIVPEETGNIFGNVTNESGGEMLKTNLSFTYGNCVINFLPFGDLKKYYISQAPSVSVVDDKEENIPQSGDYRRWFDKSELGNVNNNDYKDYIRHDSSVTVDDYYKNTISNNFANNSIGRKNQELTNLDDALRRMVIGISASTGVPAKGVTDALNIKYIDPIINNPPIGVMVKDLGNVNDDNPQPHNIDNLGNVYKK